MSVAQTSATPSHWLPKEISTAAIGTTIAAVSNVAIQFFSTLSDTQLFPFIRHFIGFSCGAASIAGTVMAVYSMIRLCQKLTAEKNPRKDIAVTTAGVFTTALIQTIGEPFWHAPSFRMSWMYSMPYIIGTNFAWQLSLITGAAGVAFTAYAAYRTGKAMLHSIETDRKAIPAHS